MCTSDAWKGFLRKRSFGTMSQGQRELQHLTCCLKGWGKCFKERVAVCSRPWFRIRGAAFPGSTSDGISGMPNWKWDVCRLWNLTLSRLRLCSGAWQHLDRWLSPWTPQHLQQCPGSLWENPLTFHRGEWVRGPERSLMARKSINQRTNLSVVSFQGNSLFLP